MPGFSLENCNEVGGAKGREGVVLHVRGDPETVKGLLERFGLVKPRYGRQVTAYQLLRALQCASYPRR